MGSGGSKGAAGFRVFRVVAGGPADEAGLEIFFDYVVEVDGTVVESDQQSFSSMIKDKEGKRVKLTVYNCRTQALRDVFVIPRSWNGQGLLGLVVKFDHIENGENQGLRVLEIQPNSPAAQAGLKAFKDFIIASGDIIVRDGEDLGELVSTHIGKELALTVYNTDSENTRDLKVTPHKGWGGDGLLGFATGSGVLHRIPMARKSFVMSANPEGVVAALAEPAPSLQVTDTTSPMEPAPTPPIPDLIPVKSEPGSVVTTETIYVSSVAQVVLPIEPVISEPMTRAFEAVQNRADPTQANEEVYEPQPSTPSSPEPTITKPVADTLRTESPPPTEPLETEHSSQPSIPLSPAPPILPREPQRAESYSPPAARNDLQQTNVYSPPPANIDTEVYRAPQGISASSLQLGETNATPPVEATSAPYLWTNSQPEETSEPPLWAEPQLGENISALPVQETASPLLWAQPQPGETNSAVPVQETSSPPLWAGIGKDVEFSHPSISGSLQNEEAAAAPTASYVVGRAVSGQLPEQHYIATPMSGVAAPPSDSSEYSQSVAEAFGLVPPANTAEASTARRSSDGSSVVFVDPVTNASPDIAKLFD